jgi:hypothetical protein
MPGEYFNLQLSYQSLIKIYGKENIETIRNKYIRNVKNNSMLNNVENMRDRLNEKKNGFLG